MKRLLKKLIVEVCIRRFLETGKLSRLLTERLYQGCVRGFVNYVFCLWSLASTRFADRIAYEDRRGLRLCCGALLRTRTEALESESTLEPLHCCARFIFYPELQQ